MGVHFLLCRTVAHLGWCRIPKLPLSAVMSHFKTLSSHSRAELV